MKIIAKVDSNKVLIEATNAEIRTLGYSKDEIYVGTEFSVAELADRVERSEKAKESLRNLAERTELAANSMRIALGESPD